MAIKINKMHINISDHITKQVLFRWEYIIKVRVNSNIIWEWIKYGI